MSSSISGLSSLVQSQYARSVSSLVSTSVNNGSSSDSSGSVSAADTGAASFISAIETVLAQIGVSASSDSSDTGSSSDEDVQENLDAFMKSLLEAMRPKDGMEQSGSSSGTGEQAGNQPPPPPPSGSAPPPPPYGKSEDNVMEKDLQSLISQLSTSSGLSSTDTSSDTSTDTSTDSSSDDSITKLQESFQNLLGSMGVSADSTATDQTSLVGFLKSLSLNLQNTSSLGSIIDIPS